MLSCCAVRLFFLSSTTQHCQSILPKTSDPHLHVSPRVFSLRSSCTKLDGCGWLTPTVFDPNKDYQNLCIGWLACSYETLNHLSCQNSKNDNLSVCEGKSQLQGVEDHKASSVLSWPSSSLSQFSSGSTSKKREQVHYACSPADKRSQ